MIKVQLAPEYHQLKHCQHIPSYLHLLQMAWVIKTLSKSVSHDERSLIFQYCQCECTSSYFVHAKSPVHLIDL